MNGFAVFWKTIWDLPWWLLIVYFAYAIYCLIRIWSYYRASDYYGVRKGYREVMFDDEKYFRLYHLILIVIDIIPAMVGLFLPFLRAVLTFKIHKFKEEGKQL